MPTQVQFWDRIAEKYARSPIKNMSAYETTLERTRSYLNPTDTALEIGAGTGSTALLLAKDVGHLTSTDLSGKMIEIARRKAVDAGASNVTFRKAEVSEISAGDAPFDAVLAFNLLHLIPDVDAAVAHIAGLVRPGGYFISKSTCLSDGAWYFRPMIGVMRLVGYAPPVTFFTRAELEAKIDRAGFDIVETGDYPATPPNHFVVARRRG